MASNRLKLNPPKTELVWLASSQSTHEGKKLPINVGQVTINTAKSARSLVIVLDNELKLVKLVYNICRTCFIR